MIDFSFLDFIWKCLFTMTIPITFILCGVLLAQYFLKSSLAREKLKWFFNLHIFFVISFIVVSPLIFLYADPELAARCFELFAKGSNSYALTRVLVTIYLIILFYKIVADCGKVFVTHRGHARFRKVNHHSINEVLADLSTHLKMDKKVDVLLNEEAASPYVRGVFRYQLVVNPFFLNMSDKKLIKAVLAHELMHIKGNDSLWLLLSHFVKRIFFFNPICYLIYEKHRLSVEMAADEKAIEQCGIERKTLLSLVLKIAENCKNQQNSLLQLNASQGFKEIAERMNAMMNCERKKASWFCPSVLIASMMFSVTIAVVQTQASVNPLRNDSEFGKLMCSQIRHEKAIEHWLRIKSSSNKCSTNR